MDKYTDFYVKQLDKLVGGEVTGIALDTGDPQDDTYFGLTIKAPDGVSYAVWFLRDEEGNGAGSFDIQKLK